MVLKQTSDTLLSFLLIFITQAYKTCSLPIFVTPFSPCNVLFAHRQTDRHTLRYKHCMSVLECELRPVLTLVYDVVRTQHSAEEEETHVENNV